MPKPHKGSLKTVGFNEVKTGNAPLPTNPNT
jgi:hypothetical protein